MIILIKFLSKACLVICLVLVTGCVTANPYLGKDTPDLIIALSDSNAQNRELAARALQALGPKAADAIPALIERLFDSEENVRVAARDALVAIGPKAVEPLFLARYSSIEEPSDDIIDNIIEGLRLFGADTIPEFTRIYYSYQERSGEREFIVSIFESMSGRIGVDAAKAAPVLIAALGDSSLPAPVSASNALTNLGKSAVPDLISGLSESKTDIRYYSAVVLGRIGSVALEAGPMLVLTLDDRVPKVRLAAKGALDKIGFPYQYSPSHAQRIDDLLDALLDPNPAVRAATAEALGNMGAEADAATNFLQNCAQQDPDPGVREACKIAVKEIRAAPK